ncbi:hypothetical protein ABPG74_010506 [Tetrahymena malaccensis]
MGNDGGSFQTRTDLVKEKPKEVKIDNTILAKFRARLCTLSKLRLKKPIVMCRLGNFYNFEEILKHLMEKSMPSTFSHIKKAKDVKEVKLEPNPDQKSEYPYICPLSQIEFNGLNKFVGLWDCGCVFSEKLIQNLKGDNKKCPVCSKSYSSKDVVQLNMSAEDQERKKIEILSESSKKDKKNSQKDEKKNHASGEKIEKKIKNEKNSSSTISGLSNLGSHKAALIEQLTETQKEQSQAFKSLFHTDKDLKKDENLFTRNVRFGIR